MGSYCAVDGPISRRLTSWPRTVDLMVEHDTSAAPIEPLAGRRRRLAGVLAAGGIHAAGVGVAAVSITVADVRTSRRIQR
jgi:hypothetical protein